MLINSGIVGLGPAHKAVSLPSLVKLVPLFKFFQQNILSMCSIKRQVFLTVPSSSQIQEKTTPELYSSSVLLSVGSVLSTVLFLGLGLIWLPSVACARPGANVITWSRAGAWLSPASAMSSAGGACPSSTASWFLPPSTQPSTTLLFINETVWMQEAAS